MLRAIVALLAIGLTSPLARGPAAPDCLRVRPRRSLPQARSAASSSDDGSVLFQSRYMPCPECGASVDHCETEVHACEQDRRLSYQVFQLRDEVTQFDAALADYLDSPHGRFEQWYAERTRPA